MGGLVLVVESGGAATGVTIVNMGSKAVASWWTIREDVGVTSPMWLLQFPPPVRKKTVKRGTTEAGKVGLGRAKGADRHHRLIYEGLESTSDMLDEGFRRVSA